MITPMFHRLGGITTEEVMAGNVRAFKGDGTPYLSVPNLTEVLSVRVGKSDIPLSIQQESPTDHTGKRLIITNVPLVHLATSPEGEQILLRSVQSNDGIWQDGETIYVGGIWADDVEPKGRK